MFFLEGGGSRDPGQASIFLSADPLVGSPGVGDVVPSPFPHPTGADVDKCAWGGLSPEGVGAAPQCRK